MYVSQDELVKHIRYIKPVQMIVYCMYMENIQCVQHGAKCYYISAYFKILLVLHLRDALAKLYHLGSNIIRAYDHFFVGNKPCL